MVENEPRRTRLPEAGKAEMLSLSEMSEHTEYALLPQQLGEIVDRIVGGVEDEGLAAVENNSSSISMQLIRFELDNILDGLTPEEAHILRLRFGLEDGRHHSKSEVAMEVGKSARAVGRRESAAFEKISKNARVKWLKEYLTD